MTVPRQEALLVAGLLMLAFVVFILIRLFRSRRAGISLRMQVFLAVGAITLLLTAVFAAIVVDRFAARAAVFAYRAALDEARVTAAFIAHAETDFAGNGTNFTLHDKHRRLLREFAEAFKETEIQVLGVDAEILFNSANDRFVGTRSVNRPEVTAALTGKTDPVARLVDDNRTAAAAPIIVSGRVRGAVRTVKSTFDFREALSDTAPKVALLALVLALAAALAGMAIGGIMGAPIERLTRAAERVAGGERQGALPPPMGREVRALTAAFESMRAELEQRDAVAALAADISHELKNPVAAMRASAEVLEDAVLNDQAAALKFARRLQESAEKLDTLIRDLLSLARLEARGIADSATHFDAAETARAAADETRRFAAERGVRLVVDAKDALPIIGDPVWVKRAVSNLLRNAIIFSPREGEVSIQASRMDDGIEIVVTDEGPGIDEALLPVVFERFTTSRKADGGTGLGLAIVRAVAEAHGGIAEVRSTGPNGTTAAMTLCRVIS